MMKKLILTGSVLVATCCAPLLMKAQDLNELAYKAYLSQDLDQWKNLVSIAISKNTQQDPKAVYEQAFAQFGLMGATMYSSDKDLFTQFLESTKDLLEGLMEANESWAEPKAVASFIMGFQIANAPMKALYLGPKSASLMDEALEIDGQSPVVVQLYAGSKYFTPKLFGGDLEEAIKSYQIAIQLFEDQRRTKEWLYLDAMAYLGLSYVRNDENEKAIEIYEKALDREPGFTWVRDQLLPRARELAANVSSKDLKN